MNVFMATVTVDSPVFQKYVQRIANDFGMPCDSVAEQQAILNEMSELKSFRQKLGQPKVSNWFAWNGMANEQMREFNATKCIFAEVYEDEPAPDDDGGASFLLGC